MQSGTHRQLAVEAPHDCLARKALVTQDRAVSRGEHFLHRLAGHSELARDVRL
jgi:hypothetical protein